MFLNRNAQYFGISICDRIMQTSDDAIQRLVRERIEVFIEVGPGTVLAGLLKKNVPKGYRYTVHNVSDMETLETFMTAVLFNFRKASDFTPRQFRMTRSISKNRLSCFIRVENSYFYLVKLLYLRTQSENKRKQGIFSLQKKKTVLCKQFFTEDVTYNSRMEL